MGWGNGYLKNKHFQEVKTLYKINFFTYLDFGLDTYFFPELAIGVTVCWMSRVTTKKVLCRETLIQLQYLWHSYWDTEKYLCQVSQTEWKNVWRSWGQFLLWGRVFPNKWALSWYIFDVPGVYIYIHTYIHTYRYIYIYFFFCLFAISFGCSRGIWRFPG